MQPAMGPMAYSSVHGALAKTPDNRESSSGAQRSKITNWVAAGARLAIMFVGHIGVLV